MARDPGDWMWEEAVGRLARLERLVRPAGGSRPGPVWAPPVDVLETPHEMMIIAAVPGLPEARLTVALEGRVLVIAGEAPPPPELRSAVIHRLELPQGRFERRVALPAGRYAELTCRSEHGRLVIRLRKLG